MHMTQKCMDISYVWHIYVWIGNYNSWFFRQIHMNTNKQSSSVHVNFASSKHRYAYIVSMYMSGMLCQQPSVWLVFVSLQRIRWFLSFFKVICFFPDALHNLLTNPLLCAFFGTSQDLRNSFRIFVAVVRWLDQLVWFASILRGSIGGPFLEPSKEGRPTTTMGNKGGKILFISTSDPLTKSDWRGSCGKKYKIILFFKVFIFPTRSSFIAVTVWWLICFSVLSQQFFPWFCPTLYIYP